MEVKVTQADRDAACELLGGAATEAMRLGKGDNLSLIRTLARHRIASQAGLIEALNWALSEIHGHARYNGEHQFGDCLRRANEVLTKAKGEEQ